MLATPLDSVDTLPPAPRSAQPALPSILLFSHEEMRLCGNSLSLKLKSELVTWPLEWVCRTGGHLFPIVTAEAPRVGQGGVGSIKTLGMGSNWTELYAV